MFFLSHKLFCEDIGKLKVPWRGLWPHSRSPIGCSNNLGLLRRTRVQARTGDKNLFRVGSFYRRDGNRLQWFWTQATWHASGSACTLDDSNGSWRHQIRSMEWKSRQVHTDNSVYDTEQLRALRDYIVGQRLAASCFAALREIVLCFL